MIVAEAHRITKAFGDSVAPALKEVSFEVFKGECIMLVGPSGSGKTTLLSILGCVLRPTSGTLRLFDRQIEECPETELPLVRRAHIGFIFQGHNLIQSMTAAENVMFQLNMRGLEGAAARYEVDLLFERVGLTHKRGCLPKELSGGERQRVAVVRALAGSPPLILADEPTASLDLDSGLAVMTLLQEMSTERETTVVVVTHDARIFRFANRIEHLENGQLIRNDEASIPDIRISNYVAGRT